MVRPRRAEQSLPEEFDRLAAQKPDGVLALITAYRAEFIQNLALVGTSGSTITLAYCLKINPFLMLTHVDNPLIRPVTNNLRQRILLTHSFGYFFIEAIRPNPNSFTFPFSLL
jgi:hypothetical protein